MAFVTGLEINTEKNRARLYIDGGRTLTLSAEVALKNKIKTGMEITERQIESLKAEEGVHRCNESAYRLLAFRARSEQELTKRLVRKGFDVETVKKTIEHLKASGLINDKEFGRQWAENRLAFKPQSAFLTRCELKEKGLSEEDIEEAVENYDDYENAILAARPRALKNIGIEYAVFWRRIGSFLQRRGFNYGVIKPVVNELWKELSQYQNSGQNL